MNIELERFSQDNADLVLSWRNAQQVRENSLNDSVITRADHLNFLSRLSQSRQHYFVLKTKNAPQGVLNVTEYDDATAYWGCYLAPDETPRPGVFPLIVAISGILAFEVMKVEELRSEVLSGNYPPQRLNKHLGIGINSVRRATRPSGDTVDVLCYTITKNEWPSLKTRVSGLLPTALQHVLAEFTQNARSAVL
ncbi:MAG: hypothetical protein ABJL72_04070 [Roseobacter sp.]